MMEKQKVPDWYHICIEDIKPMGWDIDISQEFSGPKVLTSLIVDID